MASTIRVYRNGTLVDTEADPDDGDFAVTVDTTGWSAGTYSITATSQLDGQTESLPSNAISLTVNAAAGLNILSITTAQNTVQGLTIQVTVPTIPANALVVLMVTSPNYLDGAGYGAISANLTFTNRLNYPAPGGAGTGWILTAPNGATPRTNESITITVPDLLYEEVLSVAAIVLTGADTTNLTNVGGAHDANLTNPPSTGPIACQAGSILLAGFRRYSATGSFTVGSGVTELAQIPNNAATTPMASGGAWWRNTTPPAAAGNVTISGTLSTPIDDEWMAFYIEIRAA